MSRRIIFLDVDGVLNHSTWHLARSGKPCHPNRTFDNQLDPACISRLCRLVEQADAEVVLSSTWRGHPKTEAALSRCGVPCWIDRTPSHRGEPRGHEIAAWMRANKVNAHQVVILDDDGDMAHLMERLVQTDQEFGLTDADVERALALLSPASGRMEGTP